MQKLGIVGERYGIHFYFTSFNQFWIFQKIVKSRGTHRSVTLSEQQRPTTPTAFGPQPLRLCRAHSFSAATAPACSFCCHRPPPLAPIRGVHHCGAPPPPLSSSSATSSPLHHLKHCGCHRATTKSFFDPSPTPSTPPQDPHQRREPPRPPCRRPQLPLRAPTTAPRRSDCATVEPPALVSPFLPEPPKPIPRVTAYH
jgi:hypothetical protein